MNILNIIGKIIKCLLFILFDAVLFVSGPVQSFQVISEFADEIHRQSVIGSDGQLTNVFRIKTNDEELLFNIIVDSIDPQFLAARLCYLRKRN